MRSLVVTRWVPWPPTSGARHRSANVIAALAALGEVDVFVLGDPRLESELTPPAGLAVARLGHAGRADRRETRLDQLRTLVPGALPSSMRRQDHAPTRAAFTTWGPGSYDLAWFVRIESWTALGALVDAPAIIDYDDLRDQLVMSRLRSAWPDPTEPDSRAGRAALARRLARTEARAWERLQRRTAREVAAVVVCSEMDRAHLGVANAAIVPNGVDLPLEPVGRHGVGAPPTLCLHGSLNYGPNADAAAVLVRDVAPLVRAALPEVQVRLVGRFDERVSRLADPPRVVVTGQVDDITDELARADVVTVPVRRGAGTRIKVLEALAHRVPVVATSIGVEGLDTTHDVHLLVADTPAAFAAACVRLLQDAGLRRRLADAGERLVRDRSGWERPRAAAAALCERVLATSPRR
ncbi:MAG: glycosyltransferase [Microthrixaceae bacterium]